MNDKLPEQDSLSKPPSAGANRAADKIMQHICAQIHSGELVDGAVLPSERHLMAQFNASRTVVREAITMLSSQGLVENKPRFRPTVRKPGFDSAMDAINGIAHQMLQHHEHVRHLYQTRIFLERALARDAALTARKKDIELLTQALEKNSQAVNNSSLFYETDMAFHQVLYQINGNPAFIALHSSYKRWLSPRWIKMAQSSDRNYVNFCSHAEICKAIVDRDADAAEAATISHLNAAWEYLKVTFD